MHRGGELGRERSAFNLPPGVNSGDMSQKFTRLIATIGLATLQLVVCSAQVEQGAITGSIIDQTGASVPKAKVTITNANTQVSATTETGEQGYYKIPFLPHGNYTVVAEKAGFSTGRVTNIELTVGMTATIDIILKPGATHEEITVTADAVLLDEQGSSLGNVVGRQQITQLPLSGRAILMPWWCWLQG